MFVRVKRVRSSGRDYQYLQVVETRRDRDRVLQHVVANFGRLDAVVGSGDLDRVIQGLVAHSPTLRLVRAHRAGTLQAEWTKVWGPVLVFERLWEELELPALLRGLVRRRRLGFDFERVIFAIVLQRLLAPGSDRAGAKWIDTVHARGFHQLRLAHYYRALRVLWRHKARIEQALYQKGLDPGRVGAEARGGGHQAADPQPRLPTLPPGPRRAFRDRHPTGARGGTVRRQVRAPDDD
jgi:hypothetical protein